MPCLVQLLTWLHVSDTVCTFFARHALESVGLEKSKNCQKGGVQRIFTIKGVLIKRVGLLTLTK